MLKPIVSAGIEATVSPDNQFAVAHHHSAGSLGSVLGGSHLLWRPRHGLLETSRVSQKPFKEKVVGSMVYEIVNLCKLSNLSKTSLTRRNVYVRTGCQLPIGAEIGRWPRFHTSKRGEVSEDSIFFKEGVKLAITQYSNDDGDDDKVPLYPRFTISIRLKNGSLFGGSITLSRIICFAFDQHWNGPDTEWEGTHIMDINSVKETDLPMQLKIKMKYKPIPDNDQYPAAAFAVEELERDLALKSTYMNKIILKAI